MQQRTNFKIQKAVGGALIIAHADKNEKFGDEGHWFWRLTGKLMFISFFVLKWFYNSVYFYFFPFLVNLLPFTYVMVVSDV